MSRNPYEPPKAVVVDVADPSHVEPPFLPVSVLKLVIMNVVTYNLYQVYWFYSNWKRIKVREGTQISPALRAFWTPFFCYPCFDRIRHYTGPGVSGSKLPMGALATAWTLMHFTAVLPRPFDFLAVGSVAFLVPVQAYANSVNAVVSPGHDRNSRFTAWNWMTIVLIGSLIVLIVLEELQLLPASDL